MAMLLERFKLRASEIDGDAHAAVFVFEKQVFRQAGCLFAKEEVAIIGIVYIRVLMDRFCGEKEKGLVNPKNLSREAYQELIRENPAYGNVICRCETVTEGGNCGSHSSIDSREVT